jgi:transketolase
MRTIFGEALTTVGERNEDLVVLTADVAKPTNTQKFGDKYPERFFNVGISEQDMVDIAAGLALSGKTPLIAAFASFLMRGWEQIRSTVARANLNVKIVGTHAGLTSADDGSTHQALEDVALMRVIPNMTIVVPGDAREIAEATEAIIAHRGPVYLRLGRDEEPKLFDGENVFKLGRAVTVKDGSDVTVFSNGFITSEVLAAAKISRVSTKVVHVPTVKPLDRETIIAAARETGAVVCAEEHSVIGGLGGAIAELLSREYPVCVRCLGVDDVFGESGSHAELLRRHGLLAESIEAVIEDVQRCKKH